jgi:hypothetical protein
MEQVWKLFNTEHYNRTEEKNEACNDTITGQW